MIRLGRQSIRNKLIWIIAAATVLPLIAGISVILFNDIRTFKREMVDNTVLIARVTAENSIADLAFDDRDAGAKTLAKLASVPAVRRAFLFDGSGRLFSAYSSHSSDRQPPKGPQSNLRAFTGSELHVSEPVMYGGEHYGTIYLVVSTDALQTKVRHHLLASLIVIVIIVAVAILLALRLEKIVSEPILNLADLAREISEKHDYSVRVPVASEDEVGVLADSFNEMLTEIERRERERDEADQRSREKSQFLANMSHELRTPLNAVIGFSDILRTRLSGKIGEREHKFLEYINTSGQHLLGLVNDILDLSKIEAGRMEINPDVVRLSSAIDSVCSLMRGVSTNRRISFAIELEENLPELEADPVKVKQVLYNLLSNAVKFSPEGSTVTIRARTRSASEPPIYVDAVRISVIDQGMGIDPRDHRRIFHEFQQIDSASTRQFGGTGLGLTLVKKFVEMHSGAVEIESALGRGSTFTVTFPRKFRGAPLPEASPDIVDSRPDQLRVLVIEDDIDAFHTIERQLRLDDYVPVHAKSGEEGIALARQLQPAAITLDLILPGIDGTEVLKRLKADAKTRAIPVIIVSMVENRELGLAFGAKDYIVKPVDDEQLLESLHRILQPSPAAAKLLVIDDDRELHDILDSRLRVHGYSLLHAYGASEGIARASEESPSLVILDLMMQEMNGFDVAAQLNADPRTARLPILAITSNELSNGDRQRLRGKITALMEKGELSGSRLASVIRDLLRRPPQADYA